MSYYYLDTSALAKYYIEEVGTNWIRTLVKTKSSLLIVSHLINVEIFSAFTRRMREGSLTPTDYARLKAAFHQDYLYRYQIILATIPIVDAACDLLERYPLRAYDATHLAVAVEANSLFVAYGYPALTFLSADDRLNDAAAYEGLTVDNPNHHP